MVGAPKHNIFCLFLRQPVKKVFLITVPILGWTIVASFPHIFVKLRLGAFIPRSVGLSVGRSVHPKNYKKLQNFTKPFNTWLNISKDCQGSFSNKPELPWRSRHFLHGVLKTYHKGLFKHDISTLGGIIQQGCLFRFWHGMAWGGQGSKIAA